MAGFTSGGAGVYDPTGAFDTTDFLNSVVAEQTAANGNALENGTFTVGEPVTFNGSDFGLTYAGTAIVDGVNMIVTEDFIGFTTFYTPTGVNPNTVTWPAMLSDITINPVSAPACFLKGSLIATPNGEVAVEDLSIGDTVLTADGRSVPVLWVGRQTVNAWRYGAHMQPVRIRAGALGDSLPHTDLNVTADHGMVVDGYVINASALVNGDTIDFVPMHELSDSFTVYHIETENHDVILANGAPSETFIDVAGRRAFDNYQEYLDLYGADRIIPENPMPRITSARLVQLALSPELPKHQSQQATGT